MIWSELKGELGLEGIYIMPFPHFSYDVAEGYDRPKMEKALGEVALTIPPFSVRTKGLATFEGDWPVVVVAVNADSGLQGIHKKIWGIASQDATNQSPYYHPGKWFPHISLAYGDELTRTPLSSKAVQRVRFALKSRNLDWEIKVESVSLVEDKGTVQEPVSTFRLKGS